MNKKELNESLVYLRDVFGILVRKKIRNKRDTERGLDGVVNDLEILYTDCQNNAAIDCGNIEDGILELLKSIAAYRKMLGSHQALCELYPAPGDWEEVKQMEKDFIYSE